MNKMVRFSDKQTRAIELLASDSTKDLKEIAVEVGISLSTLDNWRKDPGFIQAHYDRYMQLFNGKIPIILDALIREAQLGNVPAIKLALEHSGKLIKRINIKVESPYEKFLNLHNVEDAEVIEVIEDYDLPKGFPERDEKNDHPRIRVREEKKAIEKTIKKLTPTKKRGLNPKISPEQRAKNRKKSLVSYKRQKRAKKAGMKPLGMRSGTAKQRWYAELERREAELNESKG